MNSYAQKSTLDYSNARITVIPEIPSPKTPSLTTDLWEKQKKSRASAEFKADPDSALGYDRLDKNSEWKTLSLLVKSRLKFRGISADASYISDYLRIISNERQDALDAKNEAERAEKVAEYNLHISKLKPKHAAILLLYNCHHLSFMDIAKPLNISDEQAGNEFRAAEKYFNSDLIQIDFLGHEITMDAPVDDLIAVLVAGARACKSPAGRKPKGQSKKPQTEDLFQGVF
jgi:DNA-directed RNA polymerase specialized sigma24 family protein